MIAPHPPDSPAAVELDVLSCPLDGIRLIEASAGTGKTWAICSLYLRLLLERQLALSRILVVTFTNAAAAELRERIRNRLAEMIHLVRPGATTADPFAERLLARAATTTGADRASLALCLSNALHSFDEAAVFTIHGFCQRVLAETPFAARLPFSLELLHDDRALHLQAVQDFWRRHVAGQETSPILARFLARRQDSPEVWASLLARQTAKPRSRVIWPVGPGAARPDDGALQAAFAQARRSWTSGGVSAEAALLEGIGALNANSYKAETVASAARAWQAWLANGDALAAPADEAARLSLFDADVIGARTKKNQSPPAHPFFVAARELLAAYGALTQTLELARLGLLRRMFEEAGSSLRQEKLRQRLLSFDDLLQHVDGALGAGENAWLRESLRTRYPVALIDEFQDTDPQQYSIFRSIYGAGETQPSGSLFLVGDPKQAIYSFRNADLPTYLAARRHAGTPFTLRSNQRSTPALLAAYNALFTANPRCFILPGLSYPPVSAGEKPRPLLLDLSDPTPAPLRIWLLADEGGQPPMRADAVHRVLAATAYEVARLLNEARAGRITLDQRPLSAGDIALIVRSHAQGRQLREALRRLGIGSVELSQQNIFHTSDAEDLERVLHAVLEPSRPSLLMAALATCLLGHDAAAIAALGSDQAGLLQRMVRFTDYRELWLRRGVGVMLRRWLEDEGVARRVLALSDGERRLTNVLHLSELLHQAELEQGAPDALLRWFAGRRRSDGADEVAQLRLESDQDLVQIVTVHKAKGLEYSVVFCPFLWSGQSNAADRLEGCEYHDDEDRPVIDFRPELAPAEAESIRQRRRAARDAESMRQIYVALTRAVHRCYLVAGCYSTLAFGRPSLTAGNRSVLNWLVAGAGMEYAQWLEHRLTAEQINQAWRALAADGAPLALAPLPLGAVALAPSTSGAEALGVAAAPGPITGGWRIDSFTSLQHARDHEAAAIDHDGRTTGEPTAAEWRGAPPSIPRELASDDILRFPRGAAAGDCLHQLFERVDFADARQWPDAIAQTLAAHPQVLADLPAEQSPDHLPRMLQRLLADVLTTPLANGIVLSRIGRAHRLTEMGFTLPAAPLAAQTLNHWLQTRAYPVPRLDFIPLAGYLRGYIDLIFQYDGRFHIVDWKSNHLGYEASDYAQDRLALAMAEHGYHLQYLLYTVAVQRYLRQRIADYDYQRHFGSVHYLFVRGVRPQWQTADNTGDSAGTCGVYSHRPTLACIESLDALLLGDGSGRAR